MKQHPAVPLLRRMAADVARDKPTIPTQEAERYLREACAIMHVDLKGLDAIVLYSLIFDAYEARMPDTGAGHPEVWD